MNPFRMIARAVLSLVDDSSKTQTAQIEAFAGDVHDEVEHFQPHGLTSVPKPGSEGLVVFVAGNHDHPILLNVEDRRHRPTNLAEGETALWNTSAHTLVLYHDRAELICPKFVVQAAEEVFFDTPVVRTSGEIKADGDITDSGGAASMRGMREIYNSHNHAENDAGGPTDPPNQKMGA